MVLTIWPWYASCWIIQKSQKMHFWMIQSAEKEVIGCFLEFVLLDRLDIVYHDSTKCWLTFGSGNRSCKINELCRIIIVGAEKSQKWGMWSHFVRQYPFPNTLTLNREVSKKKKKKKKRLELEVTFCTSQIVMQGGRITSHNFLLVEIHWLWMVTKAS